MRILLDTHVALWVLLDRKRLTPSVTALIVDSANSVFVSAVSLAEIAIKRATGKMSAQAIPVDADEAYEAFKASGFGFLHFSPEHAVALQQLPLNHRDPFDRMLICQALAEPMRLITHDALVASYSDQIIHF